MSHCFTASRCVFVLDCFSFIVFICVFTIYSLYFCFYYFIKVQLDKINNVLIFFCSDIISPSM